MSRFDSRFIGVIGLAGRAEVFLTDTFKSNSWMPWSMSIDLVLRPSSECRPSKYAPAQSYMAMPASQFSLPCTESHRIFQIIFCLPWGTISIESTRSRAIKVSADALNIPIQLLIIIYPKSHTYIVHSKGKWKHTNDSDLVSLRLGVTYGFRVGKT